MKHFSILRDASLALRGRLFQALSGEMDVDFGVTNQTAEIVLDAPDDKIGDAARLSVYLYHVEADPYARLQSAEPGRLPLRLHYMITPLRGDQDQRQLMLGRILQDFYDHPTFALPGEEPQDEDASLRLQLSALSPEEMERRWRSLSVASRLSVAVQVHGLCIKSALRRTPAEEVRTAKAVLMRREAR